MKKIIAILSFFILTMVSCKPDPSFDAQKKENITFKIPANWPAPKYQFENNTLTNEGFELGRKLFFDPRLSRDNSVSCGSCHQPATAFAQIDHPVSHGVDDKLGTRNSPALFNMNWHTSFFWDGGVNHLESQPINPIENPVEMDETIPSIIKKLEVDEQYRKMFQSAFGDNAVTSQRIFKALAQFMGMLVSSNSKYDKYMRNELGGSFTDDELKGLAIYRSKCSGCHTEPLFSDFSFRNNGIAPTVVNDSGRAHITGVADDMYKFKVPSLRNLRFTSPYMHDGRFYTLEEVLDYYSAGIKPSPTLDPSLEHGIALTSTEKEELLKFLATLNDEEFVTDARFQEN